MRIGYLHDGRGENDDAWRELASAAAAIGHQIISCRSSDALEACRPEFVISAAPLSPKLADVPHYAVVHEPRDTFLTDRDAFSHLLTHDGYLAISDTLQRFLRGASYAIVRHEPVGAFVVTPRRQETTADLPRLLARKRLALVYAETSRQRSGSFVAMLGDDVPVHVWRDLPPGIAGGALGGHPLPGIHAASARACYAEHGVGLCLAGDVQRREDLVPPELFDIVSVGAIAICGELPWIRRHFGDSVYYVDASAADGALAASIRECLDHIRREPAVAIAKAAEAHATFERAFAAEVLLDRLIAHHDRIMACRHDRLTSARTTYNPVVSVVVRCGGRPLQTIERALRSLEAQTYGQFEVLFVRYRPLDLEPLLRQSSPNIVSKVVVDVPGGNRSATLWAGLRRVKGDYFAILDDDDWLFRDHFERLFQPWPLAPASRFVAHSGSITHDLERAADRSGAAERRRLFRFAPCRGGELAAGSDAFASNCFVASADLLTAGLLDDPQMATGEDSYLILSLLAQARPQFSYGATGVHERGRRDQSAAIESARRFEDELMLYLRLFGPQRPPMATRDGWEELAALWRSRQVRTQSVVIPSADRLTYKIADCALSLVPDANATILSTGFQSKGSKFFQQSLAQNPSAGSAVVYAQAPWSYGALLRLWAGTRPVSDCLIVAEVVVQEGEVGIGMLNGDESDFAFRRRLQSDERIQEVHIPVPDMNRAGRLVIQNWDHPQRSIVALRSITVLGRSA